MAAGQGGLLRLAPLVPSRSVLEMQIPGPILDQLTRNLGCGAQSLR